MADKLAFLKQTLIKNLTEEIKNKNISDFVLSEDHFDGILISAFSAAEVNMRVTSKKFIKAVLSLQIIYQETIEQNQLLDNYNFSDLSRKEIRGIIYKNKNLNDAYNLAKEVKSNVFFEHFSTVIADTMRGQWIQEQQINKKLSFGQYKKINKLKKGSVYKLFFSFPFLLKKKKYSEILPKIILFGEKIGVLKQYIEDFLDYSLLNDVFPDHPPFQNYKNQKWTLPCFFIPSFAWGKDLKSFLLYLLEYPLNLLEETYHFFLKKQLQWHLKKSKVFFGADTYALFKLLFKRWNVSIVRSITFEKNTKLLCVKTKTDLLKIQNKNLLSLFDYKKNKKTFLLTESFVDSNGKLEKKWISIFKKGNLFNYNFFSFVRLFISNERQTCFFAIMFFAYLINDIKNKQNTEEKNKNFFFIWKVILKQTYYHQLPLMPFLGFLTDETKKAFIPLEYLLILIETKKKEMFPFNYPAYYAHKKELYLHCLNFGGVIGLWVFKRWSVEKPKNKLLFKQKTLINTSKNQQIVLSFAKLIQLTELIKTMKTDLRKNRFYLPIDLLDKNKLTLDDLYKHERNEHPINFISFKKNKHHSNFKDEISYQKMMFLFIEEIKSHYQYFLKHVNDLPFVLKFSLTIVSFLYKGILDKVIKNNYDNLSKTPRLSLLDKVKQIFKAIYHLVALKKN